jgi:hypothetical protein
VGGGLVRSLGGWSAVRALRGRGEKQEFDERILGDGEFVESVLAEAGVQREGGMKSRPKKRKISNLAEKVCRGLGVSLTELRSGSRRHEVVEARGELSRVAVMEHGYSGAEVARYMGVTNSCITRSLSSGGKKTYEALR